MLTRVSTISRRFLKPLVLKAFQSFDVRATFFFTPKGLVLKAFATFDRGYVDIGVNAIYIDGHEDDDENRPGTKLQIHLD